MKTFSDRWRQLDWDDIRLRINGKTAADVEHALNASQLSRDDLMALLSPAAADFLEPLAQRAQRLTRQRFGNTVSFYVPLYLSNLCANDCTYCGFSMSNRIKRKTLDEDEIKRECTAIRELGLSICCWSPVNIRQKSEWITFVAICPPFAASLPRYRWKFSRCQKLNMRS